MTFTITPGLHPDVPEDEYHADKTLTSTDGMVTLVWSPLYQINLTDANNNAVVVRLDMPPT